MGFRLSRLAHAMIALTLSSTALQAAEQSDDFYIEIKGPNSSVQTAAPEQQPQATEIIQTERAPAQGASGTKQAKPYVPEKTDRFAITPTSKTYGPVRSTDTAWSISENIRKIYPGENITTIQVLRALFRKNPRAFGGRKMDNLLAGVRLSLPTLEEIQAPRTQTAPVTAKPVVAVTKPVEKAQPAPVVSPQEPVKVENTVVATTAPTTASIVEPVQKTDPPVETSQPEVAKAPETSAAQPSEVVASTDPTLIDPKVHELVGTTDTTPAPAVTTPVATEPDPQLTQELKVTQNENETLKGRVQELNAQIGALQARVENQDELKSQITDLEEKLKDLEAQKTAVTTDEHAAPKEEASFWQDLLSTPLNLLLLIALPVLAVLVLVSFWLSIRSKRELARREQEMAETTALMMDDSNSQFDDLLSVDIGNEDVIPDLNVEAKDHQEPEIDLSLPDEDFHESMQAAMAPSVEESAVELIDELPDLNMLDEETALFNGETIDSSSEPESKAEPDFSSLLSDQDLANALEQEFAALEDDDVQLNESITASEPASATLSDEDIAQLLGDFGSSAPEVSPKVEVSEIEPEIETTDISFDVDMEQDELSLGQDDVNQFDLEKLQGQAGVQMNDQIVSEPEGWEITPEFEETAAPISETTVNLESIKDDTGKDWTKQFEQPDEVADDFVSIDKLLEESDKSDINPDALQANLDVGLDEFPDMLPEQNGVDIDDDGGIGAKLDLARAYLEIDDKDSAKELLLEVADQGTDTQIKEAQKLLNKIA